MTDKPKRGGPGRNQGRKTLTPDGPAVRVTLTLSQAQKEKLMKLGGSAWVRCQIDESGA